MQMVKQRIETVLLAVVLAGVWGPALSGQLEKVATVRGRVVDDLRGSGLGQAHVRLTDGKGGEVKLCDSGADGRFEFSASPGSYQLVVEKPDSFPESMSTLSLPDAGDVNLGDIVLTTMRTITGTVKWDDGEPAERASVRILPATGGTVEYQEKVSGMSYRVDARGNFSIQKLRPGRYGLLVSYGASQTADGFAPRIAQPVFYPGVDFISGASTVDLWNFAEVTDVSMKLTELPGVSVEGVTVASSQTPAGGEVFINLIVPGVPAPALTTLSSRLGRPFRLVGIPKGSYYLIARMRDAIAVQPLNVGAEPVRGITLAFPEADAFPGRVEFEASSPGKSAEAYKEGLQILGNSDALGWYSISTVSRDDGSFSFREFAANQTYTLSFPQPMEDFYVAAVIQEGKEQRLPPFTATLGSGLVRVVLRKDGGKITGNIRDLAESPRRPVIVLAPKNRGIRDWYRTTSVDRFGAFSISNIVPGEYDAYAFDRNPQDRYFDEKFLDGYGSSKTAVTIKPGDAVALQPPVIKLGDVTR
jgi:hypothetical protein